jgi:hypothetical protein
MVMDIPDDIKSILDQNETVELYIKERIYHPKISIDSLLVTNERVILRHPHSLGMKNDYTAYSYSDITGATLEKGLTRSSIKLMIKDKVGSLHLERLPTHLAEKAYGIIREYIGRFQAPFTSEKVNTLDVAPPETAAQEDAPAPPAEQRAGPAPNAPEPGPAKNTSPKYCPYCGAPLTGSPYCGNCGNKLED